MLNSPPIVPDSAMSTALPGTIGLSSGRRMTAVGSAASAHGR